MPNDELIGLLKNLKSEFAKPDAWARQKQIASENFEKFCDNAELNFQIALDRFSQQDVLNALQDPQFDTGALNPVENTTNHNDDLENQLPYFGLFCTL